MQEQKRRKRKACPDRKTARHETVLRGYAPERICSRPDGQSLTDMKKGTGMQPVPNLKSVFQDYFTVAMWAIISRTLFEYPHSLSYHETTFTK